MYTEQKGRYIQQDNTFYIIYKEESGGIKGKKKKKKGQKVNKRS